MSHMMGLNLARTVVLRAGFTSRLSPDESRLEIWRDGLIQGVCVGSTLIERQSGHAIVSRNALARIIHGA